VSEDDRTEPDLVWQDRLLADVLSSESAPPRRPTLLCWLTIAVAIAFLGLHVWAAIRFGRGSSGLDPLGAAVAIGSSGAGWTAWFGSMLWVTWRSR
jgi:hypothetical protein